MHAVHSCRFRALSFMLICLFLVSPLPAGARTPVAQAPGGDVPMYRADAARSGVMPGPGIGAEPVLHWQVGTVSPLSATPAIVDGVIYFGDGLLGAGALRAVDAATGRDLWTADLPGQPFGSSPAVVDGTAYVGDLGGSVTAIDAVAGETVWSVALGGEITSSPAVVDGTVYIRNGEDVVFALDAATGEERWRFATGGEGGYTLDTAPAVVDGVVYMTTIDSDRDASLFALDAASGDELWRFEPGVPGLFTPAVVDGVVYAAGDGGIHAVDAESGELIWNAPVGEGFSAPAVTDDVVVVHTRNDLVAVDRATGEQRWRYNTGGSWSAPTVVDGIVYVGSQGMGRLGLHLVDLVSGEGVLRIDAVGAMNGSPVVSGGIVYAASNDGVFAYGSASALPATPGRDISSATVGEFVFTTWIDQDREPVDEVTSYPTGTDTIYIVYDFAGVPEGTLWRMVWTVDGEVLYDGESVWERGGGGRANDWISANEGALPDGTYEVALYFDGVEMQRGTVTIGG